MRGSDRFAVADVVCHVSGRALRVADLSLGGFFVQADDGAPPPGQFVELDLCLGARAPLRVVGRVAWRDETGRRKGAGRKGFGIQIVRIDLRDKLTLVDWLRRVQAAGHAPALP